MGLLFKSSISAKTRVLNQLFNSFECLDMTFVGRKSLRVIVPVYRPPDCIASNLFFEEFTNLLEEITPCPHKLLISGDFNIHIDDSSNGMAQQFIDLLSLVNLAQHVLDLIITRNNSEIFDVNNVTTLDQFCASDHKTVFQC